MKNIRVVIWGFGAMGSGVARMILSKKGIEIAGVIDTWQELVGKDMHQRLQMEAGSHPAVTITDKAEEVIFPGSCDLVILATDSFTAKAFPKIKLCVENRLNVISTAEEMAWPWAQSEELALEIDRLARHNGVSVLGTGINPGFVLDLLILALSGTCADITGIHAARINDLSPFGPAVMEEQGVGFSVAEFNERNDSGNLAGHVGFPESISIIAAGLGVEIKRIEQSKEAIVSQVERKPPYAHVQPQHVAGIRQQGYGYTEDDACFIHLDHPQQVLPELAGVSTGDYITLHSRTHDVKMAIQPEIPGGIGTIAMVVNMIPQVINAQPGLRNLLELPLPRAILGDMRLLLDKNSQAPRLFQAGELVYIENELLQPGERNEQLPTDTAATPLRLWNKGFLQATARTGDWVEVESLSGRKVSGYLSNRECSYQHDYGQLVPELFTIRRQVKALLKGEAI